jgi:hypothetical protein
MSCIQDRADHNRSAIENITSILHNETLFCDALLVLIQTYNFACSFVRVRNLGSDNKTIPQMVIWEKGGEENIWSENE